MSSIFNSFFGNKSNRELSDDVQVKDKLASEGDLVDSSVNPILKQDISVLSHLNPEAAKAVDHAYEAVKTLKKAFIEPENILLGLLTDRQIFNLLEQFQVDIASLTRELENKQIRGDFAGDPTFSEETRKVLEDAYNSVRKNGRDLISPQDILLSIFTVSINLANVLVSKGVEKEKIKEKISSDPEYKASSKSVLEKFGVDLTEQAKKGALDPVAGREGESERLVHILLRRIKNNPIIIGEPGVGKTAVVEGLAELIASSSVPKELADKKIIKLDISSLIAGASYRGEFEERLQNVIREVIASSGKILLFIDEIHTLIGAGQSSGSIDASSILKPYLSHGELQVIGTTTISEYRQYFEKDRALSRRFQPVLVEEPNEEQTQKMLQAVQPKYEKFHNVTFLNEALTEAVKLSKRYIGDRFLPDKAIDLIDEAASEVKYSLSLGKRMDNIVKPEDVQLIVSRWSGVPITKLTEKEGDKLLHLEDLIHQKIINQKRAVVSIADSIRRGRVGLSNANRPIASFIFLGPTGVGKTELAKTLAEILFGKPDAMVRLDMSEFMEKHEVAKLIGAPPGYVGYEEGGRLTEAVRTKPYSIVLLDEIEKAHPDVFNILLQVLEDGRLTDNKGNTISFKNTIIIATSNIGSDLIEKELRLPEEEKEGATLAQPIAETDEQMYTKVKKIVTDQLLKFFRAELLNRFDEVIVFEPLTKEHMVEIAKLQIESTKKLLRDQKIELQISEIALKQLASEGFDPSYGARPLRRLVQKVIENPISIFLINKSLIEGDTIIVDYNSSTDKFLFNKLNPNPHI